jgi:hypothetical protein
MLYDSSMGSSVSQCGRNREAMVAAMHMEKGRPMSHMETEYPMIEPHNKNTVKIIEACVLHPA